MSTRSMIGMQNEDGSVTAIYCHFDGYPEGVGAMLVKYYSDPAKIRELLALGNLSSLGPKIGEKHEFGTRREEWCTAYGRDRGEDNVEARHYPSYSAFLADDGCRAHFWYCWVTLKATEDKFWICRDRISICEIPKGET